MWAATSDGGLALIAYGPNRVTAVAGGAPVTITQTTDYPFKENVTLSIEPQRDSNFPLVLRIPAWCASPQIRVNGEAIADVKAGTFHAIARTWKSGDKVEITFPMPVRTSTWIHDSVGFERGPLAFSLKIDEEWRKIHDYPGGFDEYELEPKSPWNYAVQIDRDNPRVDVQTRDVPAVPFDTDSAPVILTVPAKRLPSWGIRAMHGSAILGRASHRWESLNETAALLDPSAPHHLRVEAKGKSVRVFVDDMERPLIAQEDDRFAAGAVGLRAYDTAAQFSDVKLDGRLVDDFNGAAAGKWKVYGGNWTVRDGRYCADAARDAKVILENNAALGDFTFEATVKLAPGGDAGLIFRVTDPAAALDGYNGYYAGLSAKAGTSHDAQEPPQSPVTSDSATETVRLIPFACEKLRISYFPVLGNR
jgi:hypothetical protein